MKRDRYADLLTDVLDREVAADDWDSPPVVAFVYGDRVRCEAVAVWVPNEIWDTYDDPASLLLVLAGLVSATRAAPLMRAPELPALVGVAFWANAWSDYSDKGGDRTESKVALFAHIDMREWRAITRDRGTGRQVVGSSRDRNRSETGGPLLDALAVLAEAAHVVRFER